MSAKYASAAARDAAQHGVPDLASVKDIWAALATVERAALPLAPAELEIVAAATARSRASGREDPALTPFLSASVPEMSFPRYALHIVKATGYGHEGLAVGLALMARYAAVSGRGVTPLSMHRLFATCMQLGMKTASDKFVKNVYVAPLVGMSLAEHNTLERALARALDFRAMVTAAELAELPKALAALPPSGGMAAVHRVFEAHHRLSRDADDFVLLPEAAAAVTGESLSCDDGVGSFSLCAFAAASMNSNAAVPVAGGGGGASSHAEHLRGGNAGEASTTLR